MINIFRRAVEVWTFVFPTASRIEPRLRSSESPRSGRARQKVSHDGDIEGYATPQLHHEARLAALVAEYPQRDEGRGPASREAEQEEAALRGPVATSDRRPLVTAVREERDAIQRQQDDGKDRKILRRHVSRYVTPGTATYANVHPSAVRSIDPARHPHYTGAMIRSALANWGERG